MPYSDKERNGDLVMNLQLHGYWRSSASYRVRIALNLKELEYEYVPVSLINAGGEQYSDDYLNLNPSQMVPTLVDLDADIQLNQSLAIIEYLDERFDTGLKLIPTHRIERARARALAQDLACDVQPLCNLRVLNQLKDEYDAQQNKVVAWNQHWIRLGLSVMERKLKRRAGKFCLGFDVSMVDVVLVPQIYSALRFDVDVAKEFPLLYKIYEHCNELEPFIKALPEHQVDAR
jgi:maleylacetoacetate isomerase